jgi:hypothetical protein
MQAVRSDRNGEEVRDGATGSGTGSGMMMGTPPAASRPKVGSPWDGVGDGDGTTLREAAETPREVAWMVWHRGRRQRR